MNGTRAAWVGGGVAALVAMGVAAGALTSRDDQAPSQATAQLPATSTPAPSATPTVSTTPTAPPTPKATPAPTSARPTTAAPSGLAAAYRRDLGALAARSGVAIVPVGGQGAVSLGAVSEDVAWSSIKVPLAIAAGRTSGWAAVSANATRAITLSDNDAATALWKGLGGGTRASAAVEAVLAEAGDTTTRVNPTVTRAGYTPFGQTRWSAADQAGAMAQFRCQADAKETVALMRKAVQRWGLGTVPNAPIKGGWGPLPGDRGYLVRQVGVIPAPGGEAAVSIIVRSPGGFDAGAADTTRIATWLRAHTAQLQGGRCS